VINIWVEDPLAKRIIQQVCTELDILRNVDILTFGAIDNAFSVAAVLELEARDIDRNVVVTDGDRYATADDKKTQIKRALSGTGEALEQAQKNTERWFVQFEPLMPDGHRVNPERFLLEAARRTAAAGAATPWVTGFLTFVDANVFPDPDKSIVFNLHKTFNLSIERIEWFLIEAATKDAAWQAFTHSVRQRLRESAERLGLDLKEAT
jgi:hypothetical protein